MTLTLLFWVLMLLWLVFGVLDGRRNLGDHMRIANWSILFFLVLALGWQVFGAPIK